MGKRTPTEPRGRLRRNNGEPEAHGVPSPVKTGAGVAGSQRRMMNAEDGPFGCSSWDVMAEGTRAAPVEWTVQICCERVPEKVRGEPLEAVTTLGCEEEQRHRAAISFSMCRFSQSASEQSED